LWEWKYDPGVSMDEAVCWVKLDPGVVREEPVCERMSELKSRS
jgi:hypothetical protein